MAFYLDDLFKAAKSVGKKVVGKSDDVARVVSGKSDDVARVITRKADDAARETPNIYGSYGRPMDEATDAVKSEALGVMSRSEKRPRFTDPAKNRARIVRRNERRANKVTDRELNPTLYQSLPTWARRTIGTGAVLGLPVGVYTAGAALFGGEDKPDYDISKLDFPKAGVVSPEQAALNEKYKEDRRKVLQDAFGYTPTVPGSEIYDPMSGVTNQLGGASVLSMQDIANQYAQGAAATRARGAQAGQSINDIYGGSAATLESLGAQPSSEYDAMIPVSGEAAVAPDQQRMAGQNIADYLTQNQLIDAQAQGGMAQLATMLGPAYANQYAMMDRQARIQADADKVRMEAQYRNENAKNLADALAQMELEYMANDYKDARNALTFGSASVPDVAAINRYAQEWKTMPEQDKEYYMQEAKVTSIEDWIEFRHQRDQAQLIAQQQGS